MKKMSLLFALILFCSWQMMYAQTNITGKVSHTKVGKPIPECNTLFKGTSVATISSATGSFSIKAEKGQLLVFQFVGYAPQELSISDHTDYSINFVTSEEELGEVVVTASGIQSDKKALGYSMQEIKGEGLVENKDPNIANYLKGNVAGLQVTQTSTGPGGSIRIVIIGNNSIGGNNQPLMVVDGFPIDGSTY